MKAIGMIHIIENLIELISSDNFEIKYNPRLIEDLQYIRNRIAHSIDSMTKYRAERLNTKVDSFCRIYSQLRALAEKVKIEKKEEDNAMALRLLDILCIEIQQVKEFLEDNIQSNRISIYNSKSYYEQQIEELQSQKKELENALNEILEENRNLHGKTQKDKVIQEKKIQEKEILLQLAKEQIQTYQKELEEKKKQENAVEEWKSKIIDTFSELKKYLEPIKTEHSRLKLLFWGHLVLTIITIVFVLVIESVICLKFCASSTFPNWKDYLMLIHPIPILGALLWVFISQQNRAQRQLVILAKHIHEIEYIEGLLLSLNSLSINIDESMKRVNSAIDKLLNNHLSMGEKNRGYDEESIINEEGKDTVPIDVVLKLLKDFKEVSCK